MTDHDRLARLLGGPDMAWLVARARRRLERGQALDTTVTLTDATQAQRAAIHRLLGRWPRQGRTLTVSLPAVDEVVRRSGACPGGLAAAVVGLTGEVTERAAAEAERERRWGEAFAPLDTLAGDRPELASWVARIRETGVVRRLAGTPEAARPLLAELSDVVLRLPTGGEPLGRFAARVVGRAHGLDDGQPLATLTLGAARALSGLPDGTGAEWRREVWAAVGLLRDEVSSTVLTLGLPGDRDTATGRAVAALRSAGQPAVLTLRQLVRDPPRLGQRRVLVCENPVVVSAAADRLGADCVPLVCTSGQPGAAGMHLLRLLADTGAELRYHGDFDWGGVRIGNVIFTRLPASPWRFGARDYEAAGRGRALTGTPATACWDENLAPAMRGAGVAVEEEQVVEDMLGDLAAWTT